MKVRLLIDLGVFDFLLSNDCWNRASITFHRWGGRGEIKTNSEEPPKWSSMMKLI